MKVAALDLGTNTFLILVCEVINKKIEKIYHDQVEVVRLGQGVDKHKEFHADALKRAELCLQKYSSIIKEHRPEKVFAMATSAARDVKNKQELFEIGKRVDIPIQIISGDEEANLTYLGATSGLPLDTKKRLIVDVGGGSTELILGQGEKVLFKQSLDVGCVRLTERYIEKAPVSTQTIEIIKNEIINKSSQSIQEILKIANPDEAIAVAGTPTELAKADIGYFDPVKIDGYKLTAEKLKNWIEVFAKNNNDQIIKLFNISSGRADVILVGSLILYVICDLLKLSQLVVSTRGVRYGIAIQISN